MTNEKQGLDMKSFRVKTKEFLRKIKFDKWKAWIYLAPALILLLIFTVWPIINTVRIAFLEGYDIMKEIGGQTFEVGFGNFEKVIRYKSLAKYLKTPYFFVC